MRLRPEVNKGQDMSWIVETYRPERLNKETPEGMEAMISKYEDSNVKCGQCNCEMYCNNKYYFCDMCRCWWSLDQKEVFYDNPETPSGDAIV